MESYYCYQCKRWYPKETLLNHVCIPRFCDCERGRPCKFHARGGYTTPEDDIPPTKGLK